MIRVIVPIGRLMSAMLLALALCVRPVSAAPQDKVRVSQLSDVNFGTVGLAGGDYVIAQDLCVYSSANNGGYSVVATGTSQASEFVLVSGAKALGLEVQWADSAGQQSGQQLLPGVALGGQFADARQHQCNSGPPASASLIVILRANSINSATAGNYAGTLNILIAPQ